MKIISQSMIIPICSAERVSAVGGPGRRTSGFSLVEVTIALGLVSYSLLAMLGIFAMGLSSSRDSSMETALSQIALHASSCYNPASASQLTYSQAGGFLAAGAAASEKYFTATVISNTNTVVPATSADLRLLTVAITSEHTPGITNYVQTSAYIP